MAHNQVNALNIANATKTVFDINEHYCVVKITLGQESQRLQDKIKSIIIQDKIKISSGQVFNSFRGRGKHNQILFDYDADTYCLMIHISKPYFVHVLRLEEYELLIIGRHLVTLLEQFLIHIKQFVKLMEDQKTREWECEIYSIDVISITIAKSFISYDTRERIVTKKIYLRESYFEFKRILSYRTKESEQLYCYVVLTVPEQYGPENQYKPIINDKEFYIAPRINYVDDLHSNESLLKRFSCRFLSYYQAFSLSYGLVPLDNHYIREFYRKCFSNHTFYGMRLKKFGFSFNIRRLASSTIKQPEKQRQMKASIYFYHDEDYTSYSQEQHSPQSMSKNYFLVELNIPGLNEKILQQNFMKRIKKTFSENDKQNYRDIILKAPNKFLFKPRNQNSYCMILNQFSFFTDFLFFKLIDIKDRKRKDSQREMIQIPFSCEEEVTSIKFPSSRQYNLRKSKYYHSYQVGINSKNSVKPNSTEILKYERDPYHYENEIAELKMTRRKKTNNDLDSFETPFDFMEKDSENLRGLKIYLNSILHCWNARDCFEEITEFVSGYLDTVSDKMKEKICFKTYGKWPKVLVSLSYLLTALTEGFNTPTNTFFLKILEGYEDRRDGSEPGFSHELGQEQCIMKMTITLYELTQSGWVKTLPGCVYFFDVFKSEVRLSMYCDKRIKVIPDGKDRRSIERYCKEYMRQTLKEHKIKVLIPPNIQS